MPTSLYWLAPLMAWLIAQVSKFVLLTIRGQVDWRKLYSPGGMPSAHVSIVVALAVILLIFEGANSPSFGISVVLAGIVVYDALGVRRVSGEQNQVLKMLIEKSSRRDRQALDTVRLTTIAGHQPSEILAGTFIGLATALALSTSRWLPDADWLIQPARPTEILIGLSLSLVMLILAITWPRYVNKSIKHQSVATRTIKNSITTGVAALSLSGLFLALSQQQNIEGLNWRLWAYLWFGSTVTALVLGYIKGYKKL